MTLEKIGKLKKGNPFFFNIAYRRWTKVAPSVPIFFKLNQPANVIRHMSILGI